MTDIVRTALTDLNVLTMIANEALVDDMVGYFDRQSDKTLIKNAIVTRYGLGIKLEPDPNNLDSPGLETYVREGFSIQVNSGMIEALSTGFGHKVVAALATLFTEQGQKFTLEHETTEDVEAAEELLNKHRDFGGYNASMVLADKRSVQVGSAALMIEFTGNNLAYQVLSPADIRVYFAETIEEKGTDEENTTRAVDTTDLEDASVVIIRLGQVDAVTWNYLAILGRSDLYPKGRYVTYQGTSAMTRIPEVDSKEANDYRLEGQICNPLSYIADANPDIFIPEYPLAIFDGGTTSDRTVLPVTSSLYADCLEVDTASSHLLGTSQDAARGTLAIEQTEQGRGQPLPRTTVGTISLAPGQSINHISHDAGASDTSMQVLKQLMVNIASGYGVPDYMTVSDDYTVDASSGIALAIKTRPLKKTRELRIELNKPAVRKVFAIEKALISLYENEAPENEINQLFECEQTWEAGELKLPENKKEAAERIISLMDKGILDTIAAIKEYYQLATDAEAMDVYEKMKERQGEYPSLAPQLEKKKIGLFGNNAQ